MILRSLALKPFAALLFVGMCASYSLRAEARAWDSNAQSQATDYSVITDNKDHGHTRILLWLSAPLFPPEDQDARQILDQYVVVGAADTIMQSNGRADFPPVGSMQAWGADKKQLVELQDIDLPPSMRGMMVTTRDGFAQTLGATGRNLHWFTFAAGSVNACEKGQLSVAVEGDTYTYDTPIPGCPDTTGSASVAENPMPAAPPPAAPAAATPAPAASAAATPAPATPAPPAPAPTTAAEAAPAQTTPAGALPTPAVSALAVRPHFVASGDRTVLWEVTALNPDCSSTGAVTFRTLQKPQHGELHVAEAKVFPHYPPNHPLHVCDTRRVTGQIVSYTARAGYTGNDFVEFETIYPGGAAFDIRIPIVVR